MSTVLPTPAPPKRPTLPPRTYGAIRSTTLSPVSKISVVGLSSANCGRVAVDRPALVGLDRLLDLVDRVAEHVEDAPERSVADRHADRPARIDDLHSPREAVGGVHRDGADAVVAEVLLHFCDQLECRPSLALGDDDPQRGVDLGELVREDRVDYDPLDLDDPADVPGAAVCALLVSHASPELVVSRGCERRRTRRPSPLSLSNRRL